MNLKNKRIMYGKVVDIPPTDPAYVRDETHAGGFTASTGNTVTVAAGILGVGALLLGGWWLAGAAKSSAPLLAGAKGLMEGFSQLSDDEDSALRRIRQALEDAAQRIAEGGGLGNQDEDLLKGLEDAVDAATSSGTLSESADLIIQTARDLGHSTETLLP